MWVSERKEERERARERVCLRERWRVREREREKEREREREGKQNVGLVVWKIWFHSVVEARNRIPTHKYADHASSITWFLTKRCALVN